MVPALRRLVTQKVPEHQRDRYGARSRHGAAQTEAEGAQTSTEHRCSSLQPRDSADGHLCATLRVLLTAAKDPSAVVDSTLKAAQQQKLGWDKVRQHGTSLRLPIPVPYVAYRPLCRVRTTAGKAF